MTTETETPESPFLKSDPKLNPRNQAFAEIAKRANERQDANAAEPMPPVDGQAPPQDEPELSVEDAAAQANAASEAADKAEGEPQEAASDPAPKAGPPDPNAIDPNKDYDLTVDGKPLKVKGSKIIEAGFRTFQKESAADYRLELATKTLREAQQIASQAKPIQEAIQTPPEINDLQLAELIQFGTKEQAADALKLLRQQNPATVTKDGLQTYMREQLPHFVQAQMLFQQAAQFAQSEYGDLLNDPYLKPLFLMKEEEFRKAGDQRPPMELYKSIGEDIRKHFNRPKSTPTVTSMEARKEAKAKAPAVPRLASSRLGGEATQKPKTREEIIDGMRKARGQTSLSRS